MTGDPSETTRSPGIPAVLFADVSGWVDLVSRIGDEAALALRDELFRPLREIVNENNGWVVKTIGDELMCLFDTVDDAARAACAMQRCADEAPPRGFGERSGCAWVSTRAASS